MTKLLKEYSGIKDERSDLMYGFDQYCPKTVPPPPLELIEFRNLDKYEKLKRGEQFYNQIHIKEYLDDKWVIEDKNASDVCWLIKLYDNDTMSEANKLRIRERILRYINVIEKYTYPYKQLLGILKGRGVSRFTNGDQSQPIEWDE